MNRRLIYSAGMLPKNIKLVGEEEIQLADLILLGKEVERDKRVQNILSKYGENIIIGPLINSKGTVRKNSEYRVGVYMQS